jgi:hypothetical protein
MNANNKDPDVETAKYAAIAITVCICVIAISTTIYHSILAVYGTTSIKQ